MTHDLYVLVRSFRQYTHARIDGMDSR